MKQAGDDREIDQLREQLAEANMMLEAIRTGQVDALMVESETGPQLFTLNTADQSYRFFIEQMKEGALTLDKDGLILFSNSQFGNFLQMPLSAVIGQKLTDFLPAAELERCQDLLRRSWTESVKGEFSLTTTGGEVPVQFSMTPLEVDEVSSLGVLVTDLTEQKRVESILTRHNEVLQNVNAALEASNHDLQQFASVASHDLQEPVRKIQIFSMMLRDKEPQLSPGGLAYLNKVISSADRMKMLIIDILNYSSLSSNEDHQVNIPLARLVRDLVDDFELTIESLGAQLQIGPLPEIVGNAGQIRQVLQNLLSNALKFVRPGIQPEISINSVLLAGPDFDAAPSQNGKFWMITVADNGIGFKEMYAENIFSLFERLNGKDKFEGTGIGLAIAKKIVEKHGGRIRARGMEDKGAAFSFILPASGVQTT